MTTDTIAAISTGGGISAIGIIRLSGANAIAAADAVFKARSGVSLKSAANRQLYYGEMSCSDGALIDMCMCTITRGPGSYTGEDTAELHCHGSPVVLSECLRALFAQGVRLAEAGEFTKRAFLNGRMDLTQAEAVIDLIESETAAAAKNAAGQLSGSLRDRLEGVYAALLDVTAHFLAVVDYPEEDIDDFELAGYVDVLENAETELSRLLATFERGRVMTGGIPAAIIGRPNTGKSSLLNALLGRDRAIVTDLPGTTRDTIEEKLQIGNILLRIIDTAGIRKTKDAVERLGVERSLEALRSAGLAIMVFDGSEPLCQEDYEVLNAVPRDMLKIAVVNKSDLPGKLEAEALPIPSDAVCYISAKSGEGLDAVEGKIIKMFPELSDTPRGEVLTNSRQLDSISRAANFVRTAITAVSASVTPDAVLTDIEAALASIGEVTGKTMREDVVARIFERFCVGK